MSTCPARTRWLLAGTGAATVAPVAGSVQTALDLTFGPSVQLRARDAAAQVAATAVATSRCPYTSRSVPPTTTTTKNTTTTAAIRMVAPGSAFPLYSVTSTGYFLLRGTALCQSTSCAAKLSQLGMAVPSAWPAPCGITFPQTS